MSVDYVAAGIAFGHLHISGKRQWAASLLALTLPATAEEVQRNYRSAVKANHPDTAALPGGASGIPMADLQSARDLLLKAVNDRTQPAPESEKRNCFFCGGSGSVGTGFTAEPCSACGGTGVAKS